jgi:mannose-6-phosphate isomerase
MSSLRAPPGPLPPLVFERRALEKVWGGRRLERVPGLPLPAGRPIGETWELSDRDEEPSAVARGPLRGARLPDLVRERAAELLGRTRPGRGGRFPLLVKFLDAEAPLSVQVHPLRSDPANGAEAKTEAWLFLDADAHSEVWLGFVPGARREQVEAAAGSAAIVPLLRSWPARAGECALVRGGTVHAIGAGIALLEVQENSDTTYRLYDWDRPGLDGRPRPIHLAPALAATEWSGEVAGPRAPEWRTEVYGRRARLVDCELFGLDRLELARAWRDETRDLALVLAVLAGRGRLACGGAELELAPGDVWLIPACTGAFEVQPSSATLALARIETRP